MTSHRLRIATPEDAGRIGEIYAPYVVSTSITFEFEPPGRDEFRERLEKTLHRWPWLVLEVGSRLIGYAYATEHRSRAAYQWSVDVAVYVDGAAHRRGVGRGLYEALLPILALQGYRNAYAGITLPNTSSIGLHERMGFEPIGVYRRVGWKLGAWHDVGWWQLTLRSHDPAPAPPIAFSELRTRPEVETIFVPSG